MSWKKSSKSAANGNCVEIWRTSSRCDGGDCVEVSCPHWRTSSRSSGNGACVEVNCDHWHKSSRSANNGCCVEVSCHNGVYVRDSKDQEGPVLTFGRQSWQEFVRWVTT
jgi:hypothetical protein